MGLVAALRFNGKMGAILADEGFWNMRFRRKAHQESLYRLVDPDIACALGIEVAYGGSGYASLHHEIVQHARARIRELWDGRGENGIANPPFKTVEDISRIALESMHAVIRKRIDLRLKLFYGFDSSDVTQGSYSTPDGKSIEIKQDAVRDRAVKIATGDEEGRLSKAWFKCRATTFGYDTERGISGYFLDPSKFVMCYNHEGWDAFGSGKYASGIVLAQFLNRKPLDVRREGCMPAEGLVTLIDAAINAMETFQETGGNINIVIVDAAATDQRYREMFDDTSRVAVEIVKAMRGGFIDRKKAESLVERLLLKSEKDSRIEAELFKKASDPHALDLALRGYKLDEIPRIVTPAAIPAKQ